MSKVLVVDDARLMRNIIKKSLLELGDHTIVEASDGQIALQTYKATKPDLVTMDITMRVKNGVDAAKDILSYNPKAKIIMVTALGQENLLKECISYGVRDFVVKPFSKDRIKTSVSNVLSNNK